MVSGQAWEAVLLSCWGRGTCASNPDSNRLGPPGTPGVSDGADAGAPACATDTPLLDAMAPEKAQT